MTEDASSGAGRDVPGGPDAAGWRELFAVPGQALGRLDGAPVLVTALAVSVVLVLLAVFGPADARPYAVLVCLLVVVMTVLHLLSSRRRRSPDGTGNVADVGSRATAEDVVMDARTGSNSLSVRRRGRVQGITMTTGGSVPAPRRAPGGSAPGGSAPAGRADLTDEVRGQ